MLTPKSFSTLNKKHFARQQTTMWFSRLFVLRVVIVSREIVQIQNIKTLS
jgi:hypothetical protein